MKSRFGWVMLLFLLASLACNLQSGTMEPSRQVVAPIETDAGVSRESTATAQSSTAVFPPEATITIAAPIAEPSPTEVTPYTIQETLKYEPPKQYFCDANACWRTDGRILNTSDYFFPKADETNADVQALLTEIGLPTARASSEKEEWERIMVVWDWLARHVKITSNADGKAGMDYLQSLSLKASPAHWPSIAEWSKTYARYHFIPWEGCNFKAFFFSILLYRSGVSPDQFAVAETYWDAKHSGQHLYVIVHQSGKWYFVDPTCWDTGALPSSPESIGCLAADYQHPFGLAVLPGSKLTKPMLLMASVP
jgi:hypothetical protein